MFLILIKPWMLTALILFMVLGCDRASNTSEPFGTVSVLKGVPVSEVEKPNGRTDSVFTVEILPEAPRATDDLQAVVKGAAGPLVFVWEINGDPIAGQNKSSLPPSGFIRGDVLRVIVRAGDKDTATEVVVRNSRPKVLSVNCKSPSPFHGTNLEVESIAEDADGDPVYFRHVWSINDRQVFGESDSILPGEIFSRGDLVKLVVVPFDEEGEGAPFSRGLEFEIGNAPPRFVSSPPISSASLEYLYQSQAVDADKDEVRYELAAGPPEMTIDPLSGLVSWRIPENASGTYPVRIEARDPGGLGAYQEYEILIGAVK